MRILRKALVLIFSLIAAFFIAVWRILTFLIDVVDGGDEPEKEHPLTRSWYNYRTAKFDSERKAGGIYSDDP